MINITIFSFINAILFFNLYISLLILMRRHPSFIINFSLIPLLFIVIMSVVRLIFSVEFPFTFGISSYMILPAFMQILNFPLHIGDLHIVQILLLVWAIGTVSLIANYIVKISSVSKYLKDMPATTKKQILLCMANITANNRNLPKLKIVQHEQFSVPMIIGLFNPVVCLPQIEFTNAELENILQHEYSHYMHKDSWIKLVVYLINAIFWWNPFIYVLKKEIDHILEMQCDLRITKKMNDAERIGYLSSIVKVLTSNQPCSKAFRFQTATTSLLVSTNRNSKLTQRFNLVIKQNKKKLSSNFFVVTICLFMLISFCASYSIVIEAGYHAPPGSFTITPKNAHLVPNGDDTYTLYVDEQGEFQVDTIDKEPFSSLPIKDK